MQEEIGYIVLGFQKEIPNNLFSDNVPPSVLTQLTDNLSNVCSSLENIFFTIEKIGKFSILSIIYPKSIENKVQNDYKLISLILPVGHSIKGDVLGCLQNLMELCNKGLMDNLKNMLEDEISQLQLIPKQKRERHVSERIGYIIFQSKLEIQNKFQKAFIGDFKTVYFISSNNSNIEQIDGIERITTLSEGLFLTLYGFDPVEYEVIKNGKKVEVVSSKVQINQSDLIEIKTLKTNELLKKITIGTISLSYTLDDLYPEIEKNNRQIKKKGILFFLIIIILIASLISFIINLTNQTKNESINSSYKSITSRTKSKEIDTANAEEYIKQSKIRATYDFSELTVSNFPNAVDSNCQFFLYQINNNEMLDSVCKLSPTIYTNKLSLKDTVLNLTTLIDGQTFYKTIPLDIIFPTKYYIKSGETLLGISKRLGVSFDLIKSLNNIQNDNDIKVEQILFLK